MRVQSVVRSLSAVPCRLSCPAAANRQRPTGRQLSAARVVAMASQQQEEEKAQATSEAAPNKKEAGHQPPKQQGHQSGAAPEITDPEIIAYRDHQATAPRISLAEEARTLVACGKFGVLATQARGELDGYPSGSVVEYAVDEQGRPVFAFSTMSPHTADVKKDGRCSLTVMADPFRGIADGRVNLLGRMVALKDGEEQAAAKAAYMKKHPRSFWVDFGDFSWFRLDEVAMARLVAGFARAGKISAEEYNAAEADPIAPFSAPVAGHMNDDHSDSTRAMIKHYVGITVDKAMIQSVDRLGMMVTCDRGQDSFKARLPFPRPATDRKSIKDLIVEMTRAAAGALAAPAAAAEAAAPAAAAAAGGEQKA